MAVGSYGGGNHLIHGSQMHGSARNQPMMHDLMFESQMHGGIHNRPMMHDSSSEYNDPQMMMGSMPVGYIEDELIPPMIVDGEYGYIED